jgi:hypothetical protein
MNPENYIEKSQELALQINTRTLQGHSTSLNSVPCAYFRVSQRDCAPHSSRLVDFADFGVLVGFRLLARLVKMMRAFDNETSGDAFTIQRN